MKHDKLVAYNLRLGAANTKRIRQYFRAHIGATNQECAKALKMNNCTVGRHVKHLRAEWKGRKRK